MSRRTALCPEQKEEYMVADLPFFLEKEAKKKGKTQKDLAELLGITPQAYGQRKKSRKTESQKTLLHMVISLNYSGFWKCQKRNGSACSRS